ncbi:MAG TPA: porin family protein [Aestuariivirgaceae bacterium]|jgi:opacity protein-like surface antigen
MIGARVGIRGAVCAGIALWLLGGTVIAADDDWETIPAPEASSPFYLRGDIGWSFLTGSSGEDDALTIGAGVGYQWWNDILRSDVRVDWSGNYDTTITDLDATTLLGNTYIDIPLDLTFTPYAGAGLGWGWVDRDVGGDDSGFTYSLMGGAIFNLSDNMALDAGYRFRDIHLDGPDFTDHSITAGALFSF